MCSHMLAPEKKGKLGFLSFSHFFAADNFFQLIIFHDSRCRDLNGLVKCSIFNLAVLSWLQFFMIEMLLSKYFFLQDKYLKIYFRGLEMSPCHL